MGGAEYDEGIIEGEARFVDEETGEIPEFREPTGEEIPTPQAAQEFLASHTEKVKEALGLCIHGNPEGDCGDCVLDAYVGPSASNIAPPIEPPQKPKPRTKAEIEEEMREAQRHH